MPVLNYDWDDLEDNIVEEYDDAGSTIAEYTTEPAYFGNVISQNRGGVESQFHYDALGSTLAVSDESQNITATRAYSAFGETTENTGSTVFPFQYIGQKGYYGVDATHDCSIRHRHYVYTASRWLSRDPIDTDRINVNLYWYVNNAPLTHVDPSGRQAVNCAALRASCVNKAASNQEWCKARAWVVVTAFCILEFKTCPAKEIIVACEAAFLPLYHAACDTDYDEALSCCAWAFGECTINGQWPPWYWREYHNCPDVLN